MNGPPAYRTGSTGNIKIGNSVFPKSQFPTFDKKLFHSGKNARNTMIKSVMKKFYGGSAAREFVETFLYACFIELFLASSDQQFKIVVMISEADREHISKMAKANQISSISDVCFNLEQVVREFQTVLQEHYKNYDHDENRSAVQLSYGVGKLDFSQLNTITPCMYIEKLRENCKKNQKYSCTVVAKLYDENGVSLTRRPSSIEAFKAHQVMARNPADIHRFDNRHFDRNGNRRYTMLQASHDCHDKSCFAGGHLSEVTPFLNVSKCKEGIGFKLYRNGLIVVYEKKCKCEIRCMKLQYVNKICRKDKTELSSLNELRGKGIAEYIRLPNYTFMKNPRAKGNEKEVVKGTVLNVSYFDYNYDYHRHT